MSFGLWWMRFGGRSRALAVILTALTVGHTRLRMTRCSYDVSMINRNHTITGLARQGNQQGFSLIEVLISIVILSFGLLGMVGLQAASLQANREARLQSVAVSLARELAEMMRGNKNVGVLTAANPYWGDFSSPLVHTTPSYCMNVASASNTTAASTCTSAADNANTQMTEWLSRVNTALPGARVAICADSAPFDAGGMPVWTCTATVGIVATSLIKIGWTRGSTDKTKTGASAFEQVSDANSRPFIVMPVTPGNSL